MTISEIAIKRPSLIIVMFAVLTLLGLYGYFQLSYELLPKFEAPIVAITTVYPGASPSEVENTVTKRIEDAVSGVEGLSSVRSVSRENLSLVIVEMESGADVDKALQNATRFVNAIQAQLPEDALTPSIGKFAIDELPVIQMLATSTMNPTEFFDLTQNRIVPYIARVPGVANITLIGGQEREIRVNVEAEKLNLYNLSLLQVTQALRAANLDFPTGKIKDDDRQILIRLVGKLRTLDDIRSLVISRNPATNAPVFLSEVAEVVDAEKEVQQIARLNGQTALAISIQKNSDANAVAVSEKVQIALRELEEANQGSNLKFSIAQDTSIFTLEAADAVIKDIGLAILLVALVMLVFLHSLRNAFIVMLAIPASLVSVFFVMFVLGFTLNLMTLLAISLVVGILVDDSIVVLENIYRHLEMGKDRRQAALDGRNEIGFTALSITLVDIVVFLPLALVEGIIQNIMQQFSLVVVFSTLMSLVVSFTLTPFLASRLSKLTPIRKERIGGRIIYWVESFISGLANSYAHSLTWVLRHKSITLIGTLLLIIGALSLAAMGFIGTEFAAAGDKGEFVVKIEMPKQTPISRTNEIALQVEEMFYGRPEVEKVYTNVGTSSSAFGNLEGENYGDIFITLEDPQKTGIKTGTYAREVKLELEKMLPGVTIKTAEIGIFGGADQAPVQIILAGTDTDSLYAYAEWLKGKLTTLPGVIDADISAKQGNPEINIELDRQRMSELGLSQDVVGLTLQTAFAGTEATKFRDGDNEYDITVRLDQFNRKSQSDIENLTFVNGMGQTVKLSQFANIGPGTGPSQLERRDRIAAVVVSSQLLGRPVGTVGQEIDALVKGNPKPEGIEVIYDGDLKNQAEGFGSLGLALIASFVLVYLIMVALYDSYVYPFVVLFSIPVALIGAFLALALTMNTLSIFTMLGMIMLLGLVAKNAILIVDFANQLKAHGHRTVEALVISGKARLRPILMTTIAMVFGMIPIAIAVGPGAEWKNGLAWALIGGLTSSMLLTIFVVPAVYMIMDMLRAKLSGDKEGYPRKAELDAIDVDSITIHDEMEYVREHTPS